MINKTISISCLILVVTIAVVACSPDPLQPLPVGPTNGWTLFRHAPSGYSLSGVWGQESTNVWAVGRFGTIIHWDSENVNRVDSPTRQNLTSIDGWGPNDIYAAGANTLIHFDGRSWNLDELNNDWNFEDILCGPDGRLYVVGDMGLWFRNSNGWQKIEGPDDWASVIWVGPDGVLLVGSYDSLWRIEDQVAVLEQTFPNQSITHGSGKFLSVQKENFEDAIYTLTEEGNWVDTHASHYSLSDVVDFQGNAVHSDNSGLEINGYHIWNNNRGRWLYDLSSCGDSGILACGYAGTILYAQTGQSSWVVSEASDEIGYRNVNCFSGTGPDNIWAGELYGRVVHFDGQSWSREYARAPMGQKQFSDIQVLENGWVAAAGGSFLSLRDPQTEGWFQATPRTHSIWKFQAISADSILTICNDGYFRWDGISWLPMGELERNPVGLVRTVSGKVYSMENFLGTLLRLYDGNSFITQVEIPLVGRFLYASRETETLYLAGKDKANSDNTIVYRYSNGELEKISTDFLLPANPMAMTELKSEDLFLLGDNTLWRWQNGIWSQEIGLPLDEYYHALWSHPELGVVVQGQPTFIKNFY